ncbi:hypothetical protein ACFE04_018709 [Oxalis oulophora]
MGYQSEAVLLAFQNYILMLGTTLMNDDPFFACSDNGRFRSFNSNQRDKALVIQTLLFVSGNNTLLQALFGTRLPAIVGGSFAYVVPIAYIINDSKLQRITDHHERFIQTMRAIQGALWQYLEYTDHPGLQPSLGPLGMARVVGLVGLGLFHRGFPALGNCVEIGIPMLILVIGFSQYLKHVKPLRELPVFERSPVLICVTIVWIYSIILTASGAYREKPHATQMSCRTDRANLISTAPWFKFPYPLQWGPPTFSAGHSFAMMSAVLVSMVESTGAYTAKSRLPIATPPPAYVLSRGIGWQGIGILLRRAFWNWHWFYCFSEVLMEYLLLFLFLLKSGVLQLLLSLLDYWTHFRTNTLDLPLRENVGLLGLTRVGSRRVVQISAGFMIFFATLGKFGAVFASIPFPIYAALYCILFGLVGV